MPSRTNSSIVVAKDLTKITQLFSLEIKMKPSSFFTFICLILIVATGCSDDGRPPMGKVYGTVTVDGKPTEGIAVLFSQIGFRQSRGITNSEGFYELRYIKDAKGAVVGEHKVKLDYFTVEDGEKKKSLPEKYNRKTELTRKVESGKNEINFELTSK